jgi:hypothetical protein
VIHEDYYTVEKSDFKELTERYRGQRVKKIKETQTLDDDHLSLGAPPKKQALPRLSPTPVTNPGEPLEE